MSESKGWRLWAENFDVRKDAPPNGWAKFLAANLSRTEWFDRYNLYLRSYAWMQRRNGVITREKVCQLCQSDERLEVHHVTYQRVGSERIEDLRLLCHRCHRKVEERGDKWVPLTKTLRDERDRRRELATRKAAAKKVTRRRPAAG